jgi:hypothetical protein
MVGTGTLLVTGAALKAGAGVAQGIGQARAAKQLFTDADAAELARLERLRKEGNLGLSARERAGLDSRAAGQIAGVQQGDQAMALQQQASNAALGGATSTRDVFLSRMAAQDKTTTLRRDAGAAIAEVDQQRRQEHVARIKQLQDMRTARKVGRIQGITTAVSAGLMATGEGAMNVADMRQADKVPPGLTNADLFNMMQTMNAGSANSTTARTAFAPRL